MVGVATERGDAGPGLKHLAKLPLRTLDLSLTPLGDDGAKHLAALANLTSLDLRGTRLTDGGLKGLAALKKLTDLDLAANYSSFQQIRKAVGSGGSREESDRGP